MPCWRKNGGKYRCQQKGPAAECRGLKEQVIVAQTFVATVATGAGRAGAHGAAEIPGLVIPSQIHYQGRSYAGSHCDTLLCSLSPRHSSVAEFSSVFNDNSSDLSRLSQQACESWGLLSEALGIVNESRAHDPLSFGHDCLHVLLVLEALRVDLVDVLRAGRASREPATGGHDLQAADRGVVARSTRQRGGDRLAGQLRLLNGRGRQLLQPRLLLGRRRGVDARVAGRAELRRQFPVVLAGILVGPRRDLGRQ